MNISRKKAQKFFLSGLKCFLEDEKHQQKISKIYIFISLMSFNEGNLDSFGIALE
jgi:hypothetical protein